MDRLKIWFTDFWPEWNIEDFITPILSKHFEVVLDRNKPDVLFHSIFNRMSETPTYKCKKILYLGENYRPSQYNSNYSISFDEESDTNYRLPLWQVFILRKPELKERLYNRLNWSEEQFEHWCAFTVSNPSNFMRIAAYQLLNEYSRVNSYGKILMSDTRLQRSSEGRYWRDAKDEFFLKHPHKFMITYENTIFKHYCTEKLMDAFLVGSMPVYCGDTKVAEDWNKEAFIDVTRGDINIVKDIDKDLKRFREIYQQPVFTEEQKKKLDENLINFESWLIEKVKT
jgi:hypothetical protein